MSSPFQHSQSTQRHETIYDPAEQPHITYARVAAASDSRERTGSTSRTGPTSFSHILNPSDADWSPGSARDQEPAAAAAAAAAVMTQNGGNLDGAAGASSFYAAPSQQLPESSRAFELYMNRPFLETLPGVEAVLAGRTDPIPGTTPPHSSFPRPSYLEGSSYLARLEQQARQKALLHRDTNGAQAANGAGKNAASPSYHMGIARDVVERTPAHEQEEDAIGPLPTRWGTSKDEKASGLEVLSDGLEVKCTAQRNPNEREHEAYAVRADHPMPLQCGLYYFEVTILSRKHADTTIAVGFSSKSVSLSRPPGWESESWGYHSDDGHVFASHNVGRNYGPLFSGGDTIGCGVNFRTNSAFFTRNGQLLGTAFKEVKGKLYPSVGLKKNGEHVRVNFGQTRFIFDIDSLMKKEIHRLEEEISKADTSRLAPPLSETDLIQQLVLQFLQHDGYVETARAFAQEIQAEKQSLCLDPNVQVPGIDIRDDEDANNRQRIRRAILEGDIDKALKHTNAFYPQVLQENEQVYFRLRCRKFIEMIRREAEMNLAGGERRSHNGHNHPPQGEEMELDDDDDDDMRDPSGQRGAGGSGDLTHVALLYGQSLQAEFAGDERKEVQQALEDIFSLIAYQNPLKEAKVAHLLDRKGRVAVAEELNSAILQSLGKSSRAAIENVYAQTSVLLDDLAENGGPGAFVTMKSIIDEVEPSKSDF